MMRHMGLAAGVLSFLLVGQVRALVITPTFNNTAGQTWNATEMAVVNQAISDWSSKILDAHTVNITFDFTNAGTGGYLAQWNGSLSVFPGDDVYPWYSGVSHVVHFNADLMNSSLSNYMLFTLGAVPFQNWDALSVTRHELGHAMGFVNGFYLDNFGTGTQVDKWGSHITTSGGIATFDAGGLNVQMAATNNLGHVADSGITAGDLMTVSLVNGVRRDISTTDLSMLQLAYNYTLVPEPASLGLLALVGVLALRRRAA